MTAVVGVDSLLYSDWSHVRALHIFIQVASPNTLAGMEGPVNLVDDWPIISPQGVGLLLLPLSSLPNSLSA